MSWVGPRAYPINVVHIKEESGNLPDGEAALGLSQSRLSASFTALLIFSICEGERRPSFHATTDCSMTATRSALTTEVVFKPVSEKLGSLLLKTIQVF